MTPTMFPTESSQPLETIAKALEQSCDYRVLRRHVPAPVVDKPLDYRGRIGVVLDCETTGLDTSKDEIVELGILKFGYNVEGTIEGVFGEFEGLNEPAQSLSPKITALTGLTNEALAGRRIDAKAVEAFMSDVDLCVAHNSRFDRIMVERYWPLFASLPFACSSSELDWRSEGFAGANLGYLLMGCGLFHEGHRALADCHATLSILKHQLASTGRCAFASLLERARQPVYRIFALNAPYEMRGILRQRGYRWSDGSGGGLRAWYVDVAHSVQADELTFLKAEIFQGADVDIPLRRLTAYERFSCRASA